MGEPCPITEPRGGGPPSSPFRELGEGVGEPRPIPQPRTELCLLLRDGQAPAPVSNQPGGRRHISGGLGWLRDGPTGEGWLFCEVLRLPAAAARTGLAPVPAVWGAGCVQGGGSAGVGVPRCGTLGLHRASAGACAQNPGAGAVPLMGRWSRDLVKGGLDSTGGFQGEQRSCGAFLGAPAPGRLNSSCLPSREGVPWPVCADTRARPRTSPC